MKPEMSEMAYPPAAHVKAGEEVQRVTSQPTASQTPMMSPTIPIDERNEVLRLRGGCIPCPVIIISNDQTCTDIDGNFIPQGRRMLLYHSHSMLLLNLV
jgi:hypothetical protein